MPPKTNADYTEVVAEADEFVEVKGGGDFPPVHDFKENPVLVGTYLGSEDKNIKGNDQPSRIHSFEVDGETVQAWGSAILNSRLEDVEPGSRVKIEKPGTKVATKTGRQAWDWKVFVARSALNRQA